MGNQKEFKQFESAYRKIRQANKEERLDAVGTLTPALIRQHLKSGKDLILAYGRKGHTVTYTLADLQRFSKELERKKKLNKHHVAGVPLLQLERASLGIDADRMRMQIRNATLYKTVNNVLHFQVTASGENDATHYQVKVRLDEWYDHLSGATTWPAAARQAAVGRISFDCSCGRHQYWYRYLATIGGFALTPKEKDFPKIKNPKLQGCCCKHVLKVFTQLKSPSIHQILAKEMERQAKSKGYVDKGHSRFLGEKDLEKAKKARGSERESEEAKRAYRAFKDARKSFGKKISRKDIEAEVKKLRAKLKAKDAKEKAARDKAKQAATQAERDALANRLMGHFGATDSLSISRGEAISRFSDIHKIDQDIIHDVINEYKI